MKKLFQLAILATVIGFASQAKAALLIEPVLGYSLGKVTTAAAGDTDDANINGTSYGGRIGYQNLGFQLGLDYLASNLNVEDEDDLKTSEWGAFVGFEFPILLRAYAGYVFSGTAEQGDVDLSGGTGPKVGLGFTVLPFLDLNLEYRKITYETETFSGVEFDSDYSALMFGVSLPFTL